MVKRQIIEIDDEKCTGCGICIPNCPEGALQVIDGKARLVSDLFCDGLGACVGKCPEDAMNVVEREAQDYDEAQVMANIVKQGPNTVRAHLEHLKGHEAHDYFKQAVEYLKANNIDVPELHSHTCPGAVAQELKPGKPQGGVSALQQWPVQLNLLSIQAPFFKGAHLLVAADCTSFAMGNFHSKLLHGKILAVGCPKFDDTQHYTEKLSEIFKQNNIKSVTVAIMEVPCCSSLSAVVEQAIVDSGKQIPLIKEIVGLDGSIKN